MSFATEMSKGKLKGQENKCSKIIFTLAVALVMVGRNHRKALESVCVALITENGNCAEPASHEDGTFVLFNDIYLMTCQHLDKCLRIRMR